jgi:hypothetical protein
VCKTVKSRDGEEKTRFEDGAAMCIICMMPS